MVYMKKYQIHTKKPGEKVFLGPLSPKNKDFRDIGVQGLDSLLEGQTLPKTPENS